MSASAQNVVYNVGKRKPGTENIGKLSRERMAEIKKAVKEGRPSVK